MPVALVLAGTRSGCNHERVVSAVGHGRPLARKRRNPGARLRDRGRGSQASRAENPHECSHPGMVPARAGLRPKLIGRAFN